MPKPDHLDDLVKKLISLVPEGAKTLPKDIENHFKFALQGTFSKLDLVTREEFDAQVKVLERTRKKVEHLEKEIEKLGEPKPKVTLKKDKK